MNSILARRLPDFVLLLYIAAVTVGAFMGGLWAGLAIGGGAFLFLLVWSIDRKWPTPEKNLTALACSALLITACLNFHSSRPDLSWQQWIRLATIFLPLCLWFSPAVISRACHPKFFTILPLAMIAGGLALGITLYLKGDVRIHWRLSLELAHYNRGFSYLVLLAFPIMAALWFSKNRWTVVPFFLLLLALGSLSESRTAKLALVLAFPVMVLSQFVPALTQRALTLAPFIAVGWPSVARWVFLTHYEWLEHIPASWHARMEIWDYMSYRIMEHPWLGWGLATSATLPFKIPHGALYIFTAIPASHPHNVMIQLWVELGLPGVALGLAFALLTLRKASGLDPRLMPFALGAWVVGFCFCLIAYSFWTDSLFAAFALAAFAFLLLERKLKSSRSSVDAPKVR